MVSAINAILTKSGAHPNDHNEKVDSTVFERKKRGIDNVRVSWNKVGITGVVGDRHVHWTPKAAREEDGACSTNCTVRTQTLVPPR
jgi:hypothetical protein